MQIAFCVTYVKNKMALQIFLLLVRTSVFPCQYHSTIAPHSPSAKHHSYRKDKQANASNIEKKINPPSRIEGH